MTGGVGSPRDHVRPRPAAWLAWGAAALTIVFTGLHLVLWTLAASVPGAVESRGEAAINIPFAVMGALIVARRPGNRIGWLFCTIGFLAALHGALDAYALYVLARPDAGLPGAVAAARSSLSISVIPLVLILLFVPLLYPTGRLPSPRWRPVAWLGALAGLLSIVADTLTPGKVQASEVPFGSNPLGIPGAKEPLLVLWVAMFCLFIPLALAAQASLLMRFRRARGDERQQLKWLAAAVLGFVALQVLLPLTLLVGDAPSEFIIDLWGSVALITIPVALGVAVLRYRLYDIDHIIARTLVYGLLTALLGVVYAGVVLVPGQMVGGIGAEPPSWVVAGATLAAAAVFQPARRWIQAAVDRRFNRRRYDAAKAIEGFSARLRGEVDLDTLSAELLAVVDQTMQPTRVSLWLRPSAQDSSGRSSSAAGSTP